MGRIKKTINYSLGMITIWSVLISPLATGGCSTASWIIHHNSNADALFITEADVDAMITELSLAQPESHENVVYNKATDRYELTRDTYGKALRDGIIRRIQDKKINHFLENYRPESFMGALRRDLGTAGVVILLLGILGGLFY